MASVHSINSARNNPCQPFGHSASLTPELEKISCSIRGMTGIHPLQLMGKRIKLAELQPAYSDSLEELSYQSSISHRVVLAVCLGSPEHGIETSLLLGDECGTDPYYSDITHLTILEVLQ